MKNWHLTLCLITTVFGGCGDTSEPTQPPTPLPAPVEIEDPLTFGVVPQFGTKHFAEVWEPLVRELEIATGLPIRLIPTPSIPAFEAGFSRGDYDFAYMNPYHYLCAKRDQGYLPLIRDQSKKLKGILTVRSDSSIESIKELNGEKIAFPAPNALGASLYMRALLTRNHQIDFVPVYVNSHDSVYLNVTTNEVLAGGGVKRTLTSQNAAIQEKLRIIYETPGVAPHPIVHHPRVPETTVKKVMDAWLALSHATDGRKLLEGIPMNDPGLATDQDYQPLDELGLDEFYIAPEPIREQ